MSENGDGMDYFTMLQAITSQSQQRSDAAATNHIEAPNYPPPSPPIAAQQSFLQPMNAQPRFSESFVEQRGNGEIGGAARRVDQGNESRSDTDAMSALAYLLSLNRNPYDNRSSTSGSVYQQQQPSSPHRDADWWGNASNAAGAESKNDAPSPLEVALSEEEQHARTDRLLREARAQLEQWSEGADSQHAIEQETKTVEQSEELVIRSVIEEQGLPATQGEETGQAQAKHSVEVTVVKGSALAKASSSSAAGNSLINWNTIYKATSMGASYLAQSVGTQLVNQTQNLSEVIAKNPYVQDAAQVASEAARYAFDRTKRLTDYYAAQAMADDPDVQYFREAHTSWETMPTSMTTLTWSERKLIEDSIFDVPRVQEAAPRRGTQQALEAERKAAELAELQRKALEGDEAAQYRLAKLFAKPEFDLHDFCFKCKEPFGPKRYRHHCRHCGHSFCHAHSSKARPIFKFGYPNEVRVCDECYEVICAEEAYDRYLWKHHRVNAFMRGRLGPYFEKGVDRGVDKAARAVEGAIYLAKKTPLSATATFAIEAVDIIRRYGLAGMAGLLLRQDFMEAVEALKHLSGLGDAWPLSIHELTACIYYMLATERGLRGDHPDRELQEHQHCRHLNEPEITRLLKYAPLALRFVYDRTIVDAQLLAKQQGWETVFIYAQSAPEQPAHALFASKEKNEAILVIRGTHSIQDVVTDIRAVPIQFPPPIEDIYAALRMHDGAATGPGPSARTSTTTTSSSTIDWRNVTVTEDYACGGMARSAMWLLSEVGPALVELYNAGYQLTLVGHSMGAAVAGLLGFMLKNVCDSVQVIGYSAPSCVDERLASLMKGFMTSVILHDDVVPRSSPTSIRALLKELMRFRSQVFRYVQDDWQAVATRALGFWAPRWRESTLLTNYSEDSKATEEDLAAAAAAAAADDETEAAAAQPATEDNEDGVVLKEESLPELYIPGTVHHIYSHRGTYRIAQVGNTFPSLRRIVVQPNIFRDHDSDNVHDALLECLDVMHAQHEPPQWTRFSEARKCENCGSQFTWSSTFTSEAQENRDRHNCRYCGACVCAPCSMHRVALPEFGLRQPVRVCDRCFYRGISAGSTAT